MCNKVQLSTVKYAIASNLDYKITQLLTVKVVLVSMYGLARTPSASTICPIMSCLQLMLWNELVTVWKIENQRKEK